MDDHELSYNARFKSDAEFGAKLSGAIDLAFYHLCDACFRANTVLDVDYSKICLSSLRDDIIGNCFHEGMPGYLLCTTKNKHELEDADEEDNGRKKKLKNKF